MSYSLSRTIIIIHSDIFGGLPELVSLSFQLASVVDCNACKILQYRKIISDIMDLSFNPLIKMSLIL